MGADEKNPLRDLERKVIYRHTKCSKYRNSVSSLFKWTIRLREIMVYKPIYVFHTWPSEFQMVGFSKRGIK